MTQPISILSDTALGLAEELTLLADALGTEVEDCHAVARMLQSADGVELAVTGSAVADGWAAVLDLVATQTRSVGTTLAGAVRQYVFDDMVASGIFAGAGLGAGPR